MELINEYYKKWITSPMFAALCTLFIFCTYVGVRQKNTSCSLCCYCLWPLDMNRLYENMTLFGLKLNLHLGKKREIGAKIFQHWRVWSLII